MLLLYILWDDWQIFLISGSNELLQQELEYTLLKPDCHSWWISREFRKRFCRKRPALFKSGQWHFQQDNARVHNSSLSQTTWPRWVLRLFLSLPIVQTLLPVTFGYFVSSEAVVMRQLRRWKRLWGRSLTHSHKRTSMGPPRSCWNGTKSALQLEEITSEGTRVSCVYYQ